MLKKNNAKANGPDVHLEDLISKVALVTENWGRRHDLWIDSKLKDPLNHYNDEPGEGEPILLLCSDGPAINVIEWDYEPAQELSNELEALGVYLVLEDRVTACFYLIDADSELQKEFDRFFQWKWTCKLIEADCEEISGDLYRYFADHPEDFHRLPHREFEKLVSSIFAARGWRTELGPGGGDQGVDLRVWQTDPLGDLLTLVQIKRYASHCPIKLEAVAALSAHVEDEGANRGLFVTSSRYLPGVKKYASRKKHRLNIAGPEDLSQWCEESDHAVRAAKNRALALESIAPLIKEISRIGGHPRLLSGRNYGPSFCIVLRETKTSALLLPLSSRQVSGDAFRGEVIPAIDVDIVNLSDVSSIFRANRCETDGGITYWGQRTLYKQWNGQPKAYDHWD